MLLSGSISAKWLSRISRHGLWRLGLGSECRVEQVTFALSLIPHLHGYDILNLQDPHLALVIEKARKLGFCKTKVILGHGTEEPLKFLNQFEHIQELAPNYLEEDRRQGIQKKWFAVGNFVDTERFKPGDQQVGPEDAWALS